MEKYRKNNFRNKFPEKLKFPKFQIPAMYVKEFFIFYKIQNDLFFEFTTNPRFVFLQDFRLMVYYFVKKIRYVIEKALVK